MPLPLLLGFATSTTPSSSLQRRRMSPGMSLKRRKRPFLFQIGPSVKVNPVPSFSICASRSTRSKSFSDLTSTAIFGSFALAVGSGANLTRPKARVLR
jgi:hypothetical protein